MDSVAVAIYLAKFQFDLSKTEAALGYHDTIRLDRFIKKGWHQVKNSVYKLKRAFPGQHIFIMQVFQNNTQFRMIIVVLFLTNESVCG